MNTARLALFGALVLGSSTFACSGEDPSDTAQEEGNLTARSSGTAEDSMSCTVDGLTIAARLGEASGAKLEIKGVPGAAPYTIDTATGAFSFQKYPGELSDRAIFFGRDAAGAWAVLDVTSNGDEDSVTATVSLPGKPAVTRDVSGGDYYCTFGSADQAARGRGR